MTRDLVVVEASGLHTADLSAVQERLDAFRKVADLIIHTETTDAHMAAFRADGWGTYRVKEIVLHWRTSRLLAEETFPYRLTGIGWRVGRISRDGVTAACGRFHDLDTDTKGVVYGLHWPSGLSRFLVRLRAWRGVQKALAARVAKHGGHHADHWQLAAGDTNVDHHRASIRKSMEKTLGMTDCWSGNVPREGSHGKRLIDAQFARGLKVVRARVLPKTDASDHCAIAVRWHVDTNTGGHHGL